jgi:hypothetical protein
MPRSMSGSPRLIRRVATSGLLCLMLSACSGSTPAPPASQARQPDANATPPGAATASGATTDAATSVDYCALFTTDEIAKALGKPVTAGHLPEAAAPGLPPHAEACIWDAADGHGQVLVQTQFAGLWYDLTGRPNQRAVDGIGEKAYIGHTPGGDVQAGAVVGDAFYHVLLDPPPGDDAVIGLLKTLVSRLNR